MRIGRGFLGSNELLTSEGNDELVPDDLEVGGRVFYAFSFQNKQACTVKVNSIEIFLRAEQGFNSTEVDAPINSFVVVTPGVEFNWIGGY